jgi:hypothetical protein
MKTQLPPWVGRRGIRRHIVIWPATVSGMGGERRGLVFNISAGGACLRLDDATPTPETMQVRIAGLGRFSAKRAWARHNRVGVAFLDPPDAIRPILDEALAAPCAPL